MNAVILDFDGPLFSTRSLYLPENQYPQNKELLSQLSINSHYTYCHADPVSIAFLNKLYEREPYDVVVSSSWADYNDKKQIENLLDYNGLTAKLHPNWKTPRDGTWDRLHQIKAWLDQNEPSNYIIIDDHDSAQSLLKNALVEEFGIKNIIIAHIDNGISYQDYQRMSQIVNNWQQNLTKARKPVS